jgi:hypothetical protein
MSKRSASGGGTARSSGGGAKSKRLVGISATAIPAEQIDKFNKHLNVIWECSRERMPGRGGGPKVTKNEDGTASIDVTFTFDATDSVVDHYLKMLKKVYPDLVVTTTEVTIDALGHLTEASKKALPASGGGTARLSGGGVKSKRLVGISAKAIPAKWIKTYNNYLREIWERSLERMPGRPAPTVTKNEDGTTASIDVTFTVNIEDFNVDVCIGRLKRVYPDLVVTTTKVTIDALGTLTEASEKALFDAVAAGDLNAVKLFFAMGGNINVRNADKQTPLIFALDSKKVQIAEALIEMGADVNKIDMYGNTAWRLARQMDPPQAHILALLKARKAKENAKSEFSVRIRAEALPIERSELFNDYLRIIWERSQKKPGRPAPTVTKNEDGTTASIDVTFTVDVTLGFVNVSLRKMKRIYPDLVVTTRQFQGSRRPGVRGIADVAKTIAMGGIPKSDEGADALKYLETPSERFTTESSAEQLSRIFRAKEGAPEGISRGLSRPYKIGHKRGALLANNGTLFIKIQKYSSALFKSLKNAEVVLQRCELVRFKSFRKGDYIATIMQSMTSDCRDVGPDDLGDAFHDFMLRLKQCLYENGRTYMDMKLENVGMWYDERTGNRSFRLIDLDALDTGQYTYKITDSLIKNRWRQTEFAFLVTMLLAKCTLEDRTTVHDIFYWQSKSGPEERLLRLKTFKESADPSLVGSIDELITFIEKH